MAWIESESMDNTYICSQCRKPVSFDIYPKCPHCGYEHKVPDRRDPEIKAVRTHFESEAVYDSREGIKENLGLERTINIIGYRNILKILNISPSGGYGEVFYTIIYKDEPKTKKLEE